MTFTSNEVHIIWLAITYTGQLDMQGLPMTRNFSMTDLSNAASVAKMIKDLSTDGRIEPGDYSMELTTSQKKLILDCLNRGEAGGWPAESGISILSLKEKLEK